MIENFPLEIFYMILSHMGGPELCNLRLCSRPIAEIVTPFAFSTLAIKGPKSDQDTKGFDYSNIAGKLQCVLPLAHYATTLEFSPGIYKRKELLDFIHGYLQKQLRGNTFIRDGEGWDEWKEEPDANEPDLETGFANMAMKRWWHQRRFRIAMGIALISSRETKEAWNDRVKQQTKNRDKAQRALARLLKKMPNLRAVRVDFWQFQEFLGILLPKRNSLAVQEGYMSRQMNDYIMEDTLKVLLRAIQSANVRVESLFLHFGNHRFFDKWRYGGPVNYLCRNIKHLDLLFPTLGSTDIFFSDPFNFHVPELTERTRNTLECLTLRNTGQLLAHDMTPNRFLSTSYLKLLAERCHYPNLTHVEIYKFRIEKFDLAAFLRQLSTLKHLKLSCVVIVDINDQRLFPVAEVWRYKWPAHSHPSRWDSLQGHYFGPTRLNVRRDITGERMEGPRLVALNDLGSILPRNIRQLSWEYARLCDPLHRLCGEVHDFYTKAPAGFTLGTKMKEQLCTDVQKLQELCFKRINGEEDDDDDFED